VVQEAATVGLRVHGPTGGVHDQAGFGLGGIDFPQFLDADGVALRILAFVQLELGDQLLAQVAARTFGEDGVLAVQFHAQLEVAGGLAGFIDTQVARGNALDRTVVVVEHFCGGEAREDFHAQVLGLLAQPAHHAAQADDVVAFVVEAVGNQGLWGGHGTGFAQHQHLVAGDGLVQRGAQLFPVGEELVHRDRVHHGARQDVRAGLRPLFDHDDGDLLAGLFGQLFQTDGGGQTGGACAHDHDVVLHRLAGAKLLKDFLGRHRDSFFWAGQQDAGCF